MSKISEWASCMQRGYVVSIELSVIKNAKPNAIQAIAIEKTIVVAAYDKDGKEITLFFRPD